VVSASVSAERTPVRRTLRGRVSLLGIVVIAAWVVLLTAVFNLLFTHRLRDELDTVLRTRAVTAAATVVVGPGGVLDVHDTDDDEALDSGIWVYDGTRAVERPAGSPRLQRAADELAGAPQGYVERGRDRLFVLPLRHDARRFGTVVASSSTTPYDHAQDEALLGSALLGLLLLLGAYPVLRLAAARALRPVAQMTAQAGDWSARALTQRFGAGQRYAEMQTLAQTLDAVLDRLAAIVRHERDLSAELSHELRTPLTRIIAETDLLLASPQGRRPASVEPALAAIRDSALAMEHILETLFAATRAELRDAPGRCDVRTVAQTAAHTVRIERVPVRVAVPAGLTAGVDAAVAQRILLPLLDNAQRYARSEIRIEGRRAAEAVVFDVVDDGDGIDEAEREAVFAPGRRGRTEDAHDGAGLGLALARRLARAASGDVVAVGPGSRLRVTLPPA
jgi:signal transduction histidine kinase